MEYLKKYTEKYTGHTLQAWKMKQNILEECQIIINSVIVTVFKNYDVNYFCVQLYG